jgi:hypothetical protein
VDIRKEARWWRVRKAGRLVLVAAVICLALLMIWQGAEQDIKEAAVLGELH